MLTFSMSFANRQTATFLLPPTHCIMQKSVSPELYIMCCGKTTGEVAGVGARGVEKNIQAGTFMTYSAVVGQTARTETPRCDSGGYRTFCSRQ